MDWTGGTGDAGCAGRRDRQLRLGAGVGGVTPLGVDQLAEPAHLALGGLLAVALEGRGVGVDALTAAGDPLLMLVSSGEALANLVALLPDALLPRLRAQGLVVSSERLAARARETGFADVSIGDSAAPSDLLAAAARRLARHRL